MVEHSRDSAKKKGRGEKKEQEWRMAEGERGRWSHKEGRDRTLPSLPCTRPEGSCATLQGSGGGGRCWARGDASRTHRGRSQGDQHEGVPVHCGAGCV